MGKMLERTIIVYDRELKVCNIPDMIYSHLPPIYLLYEPLSGLLDSGHYDALLQCLLLRWRSNWCAKPVFQKRAMIDQQFLVDVS